MLLLFGVPNGDARVVLLDGTSGGNWLVIDDIGGNTVLVWFEWWYLEVLFIME